MPIIEPTLKMAIENACYDSLISSFGENVEKIEDGKSYLRKIAKAMSECAGPICKMLQSEVLVSITAPTVTVGSPATQTGPVPPGKLV
jgi:hypothetical protein